MKIVVIDGLVPFEDYEHENFLPRAGTRRSILVWA